MTCECACISSPLQINIITTHKHQIPPFISHTHVSSFTSPPGLCGRAAGGAQDARRELGLRRPGTFFCDLVFDWIGDCVAYSCYISVLVSLCGSTHPAFAHAVKPPHQQHHNCQTTQTHTHTHTQNNQDTIIKLSEEHAASGLPVGLDVASGDSLSPEMAGIWYVRTYVPCVVIVVCADVCSCTPVFAPPSFPSSTTTPQHQHCHQPTGTTTG